MRVLMDLKADVAYDRETIIMALKMYGFEPHRLGDHVIAAQDINGTGIVLNVLDVVSWPIDDGLVLITNGNEWTGYTYEGLNYDDAEWQAQKSHNNGKDWEEVGMYRVKYGAPPED